MSISLHTIVLHNFKSYRGEVVISNFYPFTTIVGRNGSGKSNIADAVRFVLGEMSSALRVKNLSELVHGAAIGKPMRGSTYVTITFLINCNTEKSFTRLIQGEDSQYKIGNKIVTSDVYMTTLQKYGLNIKSENFVITQGYIESIAMKTPKELNVLFEQISGSYTYKINYNRLKRTLAQLKNDIKFMQHLKKELLVNKKYIIIQKEKAERYVQLQDQYEKDKLQYQLIRLFIIKRLVTTLYDENKAFISQKKEYSRDKGEAVRLLKLKQEQFKELKSLLENFENSILVLENLLKEMKIKCTVVKENISYWQKKHDCANISLNNAILARDANKKTIQELNIELKEIAKRLKKFKKASEQSIELSNSQVKQYFELKNTVEFQAKNLIEQTNSLNRDQQIDRDRLDNDNRRKQELEDKVKQIALRKENLQSCLRKLKSTVTESTASLTEKTMKKQELNKKIIETNSKALFLKDEVEKIQEKLNEADIDVYTISRQKKKAETIKKLKESFSGVFDRLSNLCTVIHSRYKIAMIKVFGKNMDAITVDTAVTARRCIQYLKEQKIGVETFLALDSLKTEPLRERLCNIGPNIKLLYNVLVISLPEVNKAVMFVTKNTLVCETSKDARRTAYETDKNTYDCVSLDGCFFRKHGIISGGETDLISKAKQWQERDVIELRQRMVQLKKELQDLSDVSLLQFEINVIDTELNGFSSRKKFIENDLKVTEESIMKINIESIKHDKELSLLNEKISKIQRNMEMRDREVENIKTHISAIEDTVFVDFCRYINVPDIGFYEKNQLWMLQEQERKQIELEKQYDLIQNQLCFEKHRNMEEKILSWTRAVKEAEKRLQKAHEEEYSKKNEIENEEKNLLVLQEECKYIKENLVQTEKKIAEHKLQIDVISKLYLETEKAHNSVWRKIAQQKAEYETILKECKMENIIIPILPKRPSTSRRSVSSSSSSLTESSIDWDISSDIDFSQFPSNICVSTETDLSSITKQLGEGLEKIQNELKAIVNPNLKAKANVDSVAKEIQQLSRELVNLRKDTNELKIQFDEIKKKRYDLFSECLERVAEEVDSVYKILVNRPSAGAFILVENPEEPYEADINYSCIAPTKRFQPMQNMSGGEKTLASLALLFAFQRYKPTPFILMDESDAALDNTNIKAFHRFLQSQATDTTTLFITISQQKLWYTCTDVLIGVTTEPDTECTQSQVFAISLTEYNNRSGKRN